MVIRGFEVGSRYLDFSTHRLRSCSATKWPCLRDLLKKDWKFSKTQALFRSTPHSKVATSLYIWVIWCPVIQVQFNHDLKLVRFRQTTCQTILPLIRPDIRPLWEEFTPPCGQVPSFPTQAGSLALHTVRLTVPSQFLFNLAITHYFFYFFIKRHVIIVKWNGIPFIWPYWSCSDGLLGKTLTKRNTRSKERAAEDSRWFSWWPETFSTAQGYVQITFSDCVEWF